MRVVLLAFTPDAEAVVALAARLCYSSRPLSATRAGLGGEDVAVMIGKLRDMGHMSPFEHASFTFGIEGISRVTLAQLTRHRLATYSVRSMRYVRGDRAGCVAPPSVRRNQRALALYQKHAASAAACFGELLALGVPREDARYCLPLATRTDLVVTMNARELLWVARLRMCRRAQWEIRWLVSRMVGLACRAAPLLFDGAGPSCLSAGACREGAMSCGRPRVLVAAARRRGRQLPAAVAWRRAARGPGVAGA
jgi:thymidylate synthase (FAD)